MKVVKGRDFRIPKSVITLGKFDGVHLGHQKLIKMLPYIPGAKRVAFVFTNPEQAHILTQEEQLACFEQLNMDEVILYPLDAETKSMPAGTFLKSVLNEQAGARAIVVGNDFRFGYRREGSPTYLEQCSKELEYELKVVPKECFEGEVISSTAIRQAIVLGDMRKATGMLGRPYCIMGIVEHGRQIGRTLGMPTINQAMPVDKLIPPNGVYASCVRLHTAEGVCWYQGVTNVGVKPTIDGQNRICNVETYLMDFAGDVYDRQAEVFLLTHQRGEIRFDSIEELSQQMHKDRLQTKGYLQENPPSYNKWFS